MIRWLLILIVLGVFAAVAGWLAENPGSISLQWQGYRIDTSAAVLAVVVIVVAAVVAVLYRVWGSVTRAPRILKRSRDNRRRVRGYEALSRGMVAIAAGDPENARRYAERASGLLGDQPLSSLLSAQAAQLGGDDKAAEAFFRSMLDRRDTEFLGVRGLLNQAMKREDWTEALRWARRAYRLSPKSEWVVASLYELQRRTGQWADAQTTLDENVRKRLIAPEEAKHQRAEMLLRMSEEGSGTEALKLAKRAYQADPSSAETAIRYASLLVAEGKHRKASSVIETAWARKPDPTLAEAYWTARRVQDALQRVQAAQRLARSNPDHLESRIAIAVAALEAHAWSEARSSLEPIAGDDASPRVCRLMAELEEAEHGDIARSRAWLKRAVADEHGPHMSSVLPAGAE